MLQLSHQPFPLPASSSASTLRFHPLSPALIAAIATSPHSRYSKLSSLITEAQALAPTSSSSTTSSSPITISLPPLNAAAVTFLLTFIEKGESTLPETTVVRKGDIRRVFEVLGVDFPPGFDYTEGFVDGLGFGSKEYIRGAEDYSSREVYEARMRMEMEEGFGIDVGGSSGATGVGYGSNGPQLGPGGGGPKTSTSIHPSSRGENAPPSYETSNPRSSNFSLHDTKGGAGGPPPQSEFHATLQDSLLSKLYNLVLAHIQPALTTQAQLGIFRGTFILLADPLLDASAPLPLSHVVTSSPHEKIGGYTNGYREVVYLPAEGFTQQFLTQPAVIRGIKGTVEEALGVSPPPPPPRVATPPPPPAKKKGFFSFGSKGKKKEKVVVKVREPEPEPGTVVDVKVESVWIRSENENGLWETRSIKGVVVWVEVRQEGYQM